MAGPTIGAGPRRRCPRGSGKSQTAWPFHPTQPLLANQPVTVRQPELSLEKKKIHLRGFGNVLFGSQKELAPLLSLWMEKGWAWELVRVRLACTEDWKG